MFTDQNSKLVEIEDYINMTLITGQILQKMRYSTKLKYKKYVKGCGFLSFARKCGDKYPKTLMNTAIKTEIDAAKTASKRVDHEEV